MLYFLPGAGRNYRSLIHWMDRFQDLAYQPMNMPMPEGPPTFDAFVEAAGALLPAEAILVGESFGGLVALALRDRVRLAIAVDPPLTTGKQWALREDQRRTLQKVGGDYNFEFCWNVFGVALDRFEERDYRQLVTKGVHILAGSVPLNPPRRLSTHPSMIDDADEALIAARGAHLHRIDGPGHGVLTPQFADKVEPVLRAIFAAEGVEAAPGPTSSRS